MRKLKRKCKICGRTFLGNKQLIIVHDTFGGISVERFGCPNDEGAVEIIPFSENEQSSVAEGTHDDGI